MKTFGLITQLLGSDQLLLLDGRHGSTRMRREVCQLLQRQHRFRPLLFPARVEIYRGPWHGRRLRYELTFDKQEVECSGN